MSKKATVILAAISLLIVILVGLRVFLERFLNRPFEVKISNLSSTSAVVSFTTKKPSKSCLILYPKLEKFCQVNLSPSRLHYLELKGLSSKRKYRFIIKNDFLFFTSYLKAINQTPTLEESIPSGEKIKPETIIVKKKLPVFSLPTEGSENGALSPVIGLVLNSFNKPVEAIVYFSLPDNGAILSVLTNSHGKFALNIQSILPLDFVNIQAVGEKGSFSTSARKDDLMQPLELNLR